MENPTDQAAAEATASIPTATTVVNNGSNRNHTVTVRRKAAKRTHPFDLAAEELHLVPSSSLSSPQAEDIPPARKKPRLEEPLPTTTDEAASKAASPDLSAGLPPPVAANADPMTDTQPNAGAATVTRRTWTLEEDAKLTSAVANTSKTKCGKEYKTKWAAAAALVPSRTGRQCRDRWKYFLDPSIDRATGHKSKWTADEDSKLKDAVKTHGGKNWGAIAGLVPSRTKKQCSNRWYHVLDPSIDLTTARAGKWSEDEVITLKNAVEMHGGKNWKKIAVLVPGRTKKQCWNRWKDTLDPNIDPTTARTGKWTPVKDIKLKDAVQAHGGKNWDAIAALVPGRAKRDCNGDGM
jgi:hypothetical protein